jgi:hypothetical protein
MRLFPVLALALASSAPCSADAQSSGRAGTPSLAGAPAPERAIRRDIPITNAIRRAYQSSTRDSTGKPGRNYWQLRTDYTIQARLDPSTQVITGSETIMLHNESPEPLTEIRLRLDHNIYRPTVPQGLSVPAETTEGMVVTKFVIDGQVADLNAPPPGRGGGRGGQQPSSLRPTAMDQTNARIFLASPIPPKSVAKLEIDWRTKLPGGPNGSGHRMTQRWADTLFQPRSGIRASPSTTTCAAGTRSSTSARRVLQQLRRFDVRITVPGGWIVSGTGVSAEPERGPHRNRARAPREGPRSDSVRRSSAR